MPITRAQFFALTGLDVDTHTALKRRDLMPLPNQNTRAYTPFEAYAYLLAAHFSELRAGDRSGSCRIVRDMLLGIVERADMIEASTVGFRLGGEAPEVFCGRVWGVGGGYEPFVGTKAKLAEFLSDPQFPDPVDIILTSATAGLVVLQARAARAGIDLTDMWPDTHTFRVSQGTRERPEDEA